MNRPRLTFYTNGTIPTIRQWFAAEAQYKLAGGDIMKFRDTFECVERTLIFKGINNE